MTHSGAPTRKADAVVEPRLYLLPGPAVHADLPALAALPATDEYAAGRRVQITLGEREGLADPQAGAPHQHDQRPGAQAARGVAGAAHDRHEFIDRRRIARVAQALVARRTAAAMARHGRGERRRPAASSRTGASITVSVLAARSPGMESSSARFGAPGARLAPRD